MLILLSFKSLFSIFTPFPKRCTIEDYVADKDAGFFAVAFDRHGKLGWQIAKIIDDDLTDKHNPLSDDYAV